MSLALAALLAVAAAEPPERTPYDIDPAPHLIASLTMFGVLGIYSAAVRYEQKGGAVSCELEPGTTHCDPRRLNAMDRSVVGNRSDAWLLTSDVTAGIGMAAALAGVILDSTLTDSPARLTDFITDTAVVLEATAVATLVTHMLKFSIRRPRPTQYSDAFTRNTVEHQLSFPSGHTATAAALAASYSTTFVLRHPDSPWRFAVIGGAAAVVGLTSYGRVAGGFHFYSDIIAGAVLGGGTGVVIPLLLRRSDVAVVPLVTEGGGGASVLAIF
jgi:membrane-associated phospholipid phosphatase